MRTVMMGFKNKTLIWVKVGLKPQREPKKVDKYQDVLDNMRKNGWIFQAGVDVDGEYRAAWYKPDSDMDRLELALQGHDWTFDYSDSYNVIQYGEAQVKHIQALVRKIGPEGKALVEKYMENRSTSRSIEAYC